MRAFLAICLALADPVGAEVSQPAGFRDAPYRAPVPAALDGATVVDPVGAHELWNSGMVAFIDVLPQPPRPKNLPEGTIWQDKEHTSIPGAVWLPNVGYAELAPAMHDYFRAALAQVTAGDMSYPLVFFCKAECWMSWNAAKRALDYGYSNIYWMPDGTDGWSGLGHALEPALPHEGHP